MGLVYLGLDPKIGRKVALKVVKGDLDGAKTKRDEGAAALFARKLYDEASAAGRLSHPNIVTIYDVGETGDSSSPIVYIAMEYIDGRSLDQSIKRGEFTTTREKLIVLKAIASGLDYAHKKGIAHLDIKPANILITNEGAVPKIADFGLATLVSSSPQAGSDEPILGTPNYMAPEQIHNENVGTRADIFALGALGYEMVTGFKPFQGESVNETLLKVLQAEPARASEVEPNVPKEIDQIFARALAKDQNRRYQTIDRFIADIDALIVTLESGAYGALDFHSGEPDHVDPYQRLQARFATESRNRARYTLIGALIGGLVLVLILSYLFISGGPLTTEKARNVESGTESAPR